jgi:hypothetical protein
MMILDCIPSLPLPPSSPFPTFIFSLVLPHSCSFREREGEKWESEMGWCCFSWGLVYPFRAYDKWGQGLSGGQLIPHSLYVVQLLADDPVSHQIVWWSLNSWNWSKHFKFGSGANSLVPRVNSLTSDILGWDDVLLSGCVDYC